MQPRRPQKHARPGTLVVARPGQRIVAPLPGDRVAPVEHLPVHDDARAHAGAQDHAEHDRGSGAGAVDRLRQREAVRVVGDAHLAAEQRSRSRRIGRPLRHTEFDPRSSPVAREIDPGVPMPTVAALARAQRSRSASPTSAAMASSVAVVVAVRRRHACGEPLAAVGVEREDLDLGAAEVDAEA